MELIFLERSKTIKKEMDTIVDRPKSHDEEKPAFTKASSWLIFEM